MQAFLHHHRQRVLDTPERATQIGDAEPTALQQASIVGLRRRPPRRQRGTPHGFGPFSRMHDQGTYGLRPQIRIDDHDLRRQTRTQRHRGAGRTGRREDSIRRQVMGRQQTETVRRHRRQSVLGGIAAFEHHVRLERPVLVPGQRGRAERTEAAPRRNGRIVRGILLGDPHTIGEGADSQRVPRLGGVVQAIGVVGMRVVEPGIGILDVSGRQNEQTGMCARAGRICRQRVDGRRPRGWATAIAVVPSGNGHSEHATPARRRDFRTRHCLYRHVSMVQRVSATARPRQQLHRFQAVFERHGISALQKRRQIPGERYAGHLRPVAVPVVDAPAGVDRVQVTGVENWTQERVTATHAGVEQTDTRNVVRAGRKLRAYQQFVEPFSLLVTRQGPEELRGLLCSPKLRNAVERENGALHLLQGRRHQEHAALWKEQVAGCNAHVLGFGVLPKRRNHCLPVLPDRQPHFPPERPLFG